ncbi:hypothetical protein DMN91_001847 [Ooceraea biroi]|uniref:Distal membrane-arm assembly complex protein 1-like domain-containing protein n=1 Tax=Ooceraea biroi TaxID=2015173 RepID=A0A026W3Z4_OOCBI|nr:uncharacterized protein LOC105283408 isoform X1 [Ooceraea biroi]XP_026831264.1 uncharacterized protein LOC113563625 isoform X1 [Ooceraea biroi]EZA50810.1 hypothetical protein X777_11053 [Ooceraea biroi]RLU25690.1 hypothetical protein DMN91_001847 [Ooceraea biroi]
MNSIVNNRNRDCFECRLLSGGGLFAAGLYVYHHSKQYHNQIGKATMYSIASVLVLLGTTRILDLPPFRNKFKDS